MESGGREEESGVSTQMEKHVTLLYKQFGQFHAMTQSLMRNTLRQLCIYQSTECCTRHVYAKGVYQIFQKHRKNSPVGKL